MPFRMRLSLLYVAFTGFSSFWLTEAVITENETTVFVTTLVTETDCSCTDTIAPTSNQSTISVSTTDSNALTGTSSGTVPASITDSTVSTDAVTTSEIMTVTVDETQTVLVTVTTTDALFTTVTVTDEEFTTVTNILQSTTAATATATAELFTTITNTLQVTATAMVTAAYEQSATVRLTITEKATITQGPGANHSMAETATPIPVAAPDSYQTMVDNATVLVAPQAASTIALSEFGLDTNKDGSGRGGSAPSPTTSNGEIGSSKMKMDWSLTSRQKDFLFRSVLAELSTLPTRLYTHYPRTTLGVAHHVISVNQISERRTESAILKTARRQTHIIVHPTNVSLVHRYFHGNFGEPPSNPTTWAIL